MLTMGKNQKDRFQVERLALWTVTGQAFETQAEVADAIDRLVPYQRRLADRVAEAMGHYRRALEEPHDG